MLQWSRDLSTTEIKIGTVPGEAFANVLQWSRDLSTTEIGKSGLRVGLSVASMEP